MSKTPKKKVALDGYAAKRCPTATFHNLVTPDDLAVAPSTGAAQRMADGVAFEARIAERLIATGQYLDLSAKKTDGPDALKRLTRSLRGVEAVIIPSCDRSAASKQRRELLTMAAMAAGVGTIWNSRLPVTDGRSGEPDGLRRDGKNESGKWAYRPFDVKHHKTLEGTAKGCAHPVNDLDDLDPVNSVQASLGNGKPRYDDDLQLAHYHRMLESLGHAVDGEIWGGIVGKEERCLWRRLDIPRHSGKSALEAYDEAHGLVRRVADAALATPEAGSLVAAEWKSECGECPWRTVCHDELVEKDHITLLPGITPRRAQAHYAQGITRARELARLDWRAAVLADAGVDVVALRTVAKAHPNPAAPATALLDGSLAAAAGVSTVADVASLDKVTTGYTNSGKTLANEIDQARVTKSGRVHRARKVSSLSIPRATFELDVDIEDANGRCYLIGVADTWRRHKAGSVKVRTDFHAFVDWTGTDAGEAKVFSEFWAYLCAQRQKAEDNRWGFRVYHYTEHETRYFRHLAKKHAGVDGVPSLDDLEAFFRSGDWVDLHKVCSTELIWPTEDLSLKTLAKHVGFNWRDDEPGGANSVAWYAEAVNAEDETVRESNRARILAYNEDDVLATLAIRDWLTRAGEARHPGKTLPGVESLDLRFNRSVRSATKVTV
jgi:predicted RecB family nuclease